MNLAIVGATGMVGRTMLQVLAERDIEVENLYPIASSASTGKFIEYRKKKISHLCFRRRDNQRYRFCSFFCRRVYFNRVGS